jgi:hypothetical protein
MSSWPCQSVCVWTATDEWMAHEDRPLLVFRCRGCGSEWVRTEPWTPIDSHGVVPPAVLDEKHGEPPSYQRARRGRS